MRIDNSTGKGTSGMDKFSSKVHRVHMELGGKLLNNSLRIETQFSEGFRVWVLKMVPPTPKRMMWRVMDAPWRMLQISMCCSFAAFSWF